MNYISKAIETGNLEYLKNLDSMKCLSAAEIVTLQTIDPIKFIQCAPCTKEYLENFIYLRMTHIVV